MGAGAVDPVALAAGVIKTGAGLFQIAKSSKYLRKIGSDPLEDMPSEVMENQRIAQGLAGGGLPSEQYNQAMRNIQRQQVTAIRMANDRRGGLIAGNTIASGTNDAYGNLAATDAQMRINNQKYLIGVNQNAAAWKSRLFDLNKRQPWTRKYNYGMALKGQGWQNFAGGLDALAAGAMGGLKGKGAVTMGGLKGKGAVTQLPGQGANPLYKL